MVSWNNFKLHYLRDDIFINTFTLKKFDYTLKININEHFFPDVNALPSSVESSGVTVGAVVGSCVISFIVGLSLTAVLCFCYLKRRKPSIPGNPHYISKQNSYVIVPLKEVRLEESSLLVYAVFRTGISRKLIFTGEREATAQFFRQH